MDIAPTAGILRNEIIAPPETMVGGLGGDGSHPNRGLRSKAGMPPLSVQPRSADRQSPQRPESTEPKSSPHPR